MTTGKREEIETSRPYTIEDMHALRLWLLKTARRSNVPSKAGKLFFAAEIVRDQINQRIPVKVS